MIPIPLTSGKYSIAIRVGLVCIGLFAACTQAEKTVEPHDDRPVIKVAVMKSGEVMADGTPVSLEELDALFVDMKNRSGMVWYYRENPREAEPPPIAMKVVNLVVNNKLDIRISSKPDYSDYVDKDGKTHPLKSK